MSIQVLVATMNQKDYSLLDRMNISSDAIIGNQCENNSIEVINYNNNRVVYLNFNEIGVGLNRNNTLMRATAKYCLFSDDDVVLNNSYSDIIIESFNKNPKADVIIFNLEGRPANSRIHRVWFHNYLRYGTPRIAFRLDSVRRQGIYFNQCFGGGTKYSHGEDSLFLTECLKKGLKIYTSTETIGQLSDFRESTWNGGYSQKYIIDQGVLYRTISKRFWFLLVIQDVLRHHNDYSNVGSVTQVLRLMIHKEERTL